MKKIIAVKVLNGFDEKIEEVFVFTDNIVKIEPAETDLGIGEDSPEEIRTKSVIKHVNGFTTQSIETVENLIYKSEGY